MGKKGKESTRSKQWVSTAIPRPLAEKARELIRQRSVGYTGLTSFVADAVRRRIEQLETPRTEVIGR